MAEKSYSTLIVDLEASCWKDAEKQKRDSEIIQIGWAVVDFSLQNHIKDKGAIYVVASEPLSDFCTELTGITDEDLKTKGVSVFDAFAQLKKIIKTHNVSVWGSWGNYDNRMIASTCSQNGIKNPMPYQHINVSALWSSYFGTSKNGLDQAVKRLGFKFQGRHHDGMWDAVNISNVYAHMLGAYDEYNNYN